MIVDLARIQVKAGRGGNGCCSFRREKNVPKGGPDAGHGGNGGHIILKVDVSKRTLLDFQFQHLYRAKNGMHGQGKDMHGRNAPDLIIGVPPGTLVKDQETGALISDMVGTDQVVMIAQGGNGGRGNSAFATSTNRAPRRFEEGQNGQERLLELELKLIADVGLVGHPNAGKSTLLSRLSSVKPKIADYPFTTLEPNLGIVELGDYDRFVLADIPGLIEGAHQGKGLGHQFLRHIERTRILVFLLDASQADPLQDYKVLLNELGKFNPNLLARPGLVVFSKLDLIVDRSRIKEISTALSTMLKHTAPGINGNKPLIGISSATGEGISDFLQEIRVILRDNEEI